MVSSNPRLVAPRGRVRGDDRRDGGAVHQRRGHGKLGGALGVGVDRRGHARRDGREARLIGQLVGAGRGRRERRAYNRRARQRALVVAEAEHVRAHVARDRVDVVDVDGLEHGLGRALRRRGRHEDVRTRDRLRQLLQLLCVRDAVVHLCELRAVGEQRDRVPLGLRVAQPELAEAADLAHRHRDRFLPLRGESSWLNSTNWKSGSCHAPTLQRASCAPSTSRRMTLSRKSARESTDSTGRFANRWNENA